MGSITKLVATWMVAVAAIGNATMADATTAKTLANDLASMTPNQTASGGAVIRDKSGTREGAKNAHSPQVQPEFALTSCVSFLAEGTGFDPAVCRNVKHPRILPQKFFSQQRLQSFGQSRSLPIVWDHLAMISAQFQHSRSQTIPQRRERVPDHDKSTDGADLGDHVRPMTPTGAVFESSSTHDTAHKSKM